MFVKTNQLRDLLPFYHERLADKFESSEIDQLFSLMAFFLFGCEKIDIRIRDIKLSESDLLLQKEIVQRLKSNEPIQYILGKTEFFDLILKVNPSVLIPRPETAELVELILKNHSDKLMTVLDIGTGSGCIPLALKSKRNNWSLSGMDISTQSLEVAKNNAKNLNLDVTWIQKNILDHKIDYTQSYDIIVSNPPYVLESDKFEMSQKVLDYEPPLALFVPDDNPLLFYLKIIDFAKKSLNQGGMLYFEIHEKYGEKVKEAMKLQGFSSVKIIKDLQEKDRIVSGVLD